MTTLHHVATPTQARSEIAVCILIALLAASLAGFTPKPRSLAFPDVFPTHQVFPSYHSGCGGVAVPC